MKRFETPKLYSTRADELPLSGQALLALMQAVINRGLPFRFTAKGTSMYPFIQDGDVITVTPIDNRRPSLGDVVAVIAPETGSLVVHRIVARSKKSISLFGDAIPVHKEEIVPLDNILGRVTRIERKERSIRLGLGPERILIAWLSKLGLLIPMRVWFAALQKPFIKKEIRK